MTWDPAIIHRQIFDYFDHDVLSVMVPITSNLNIRGYVSIHMDMQDIYRDREALLSAFICCFCCCS